MKMRFVTQERRVSISRLSDAIVFEAGLAIDADGAPNAYGPHGRGLDRLANARRDGRWVSIATDKRGRPLLQKKGRYRGYYVSTTSLQSSSVRSRANPKKYVDATRIPSIVLPPGVAKRFDIELGDLVVVINKQTGQTAFAIYADSGPRHKLGEGSIALAEALGLPSDPRGSAAEDGVLFIVFPGSGQGQGTIPALGEINSGAAELYEKWGGSERLQACSLLPQPPKPAEAIGSEQ